MFIENLFLVCVYIIIFSVFGLICALIGSMIDRKYYPEYEDKPIAKQNNKKVSELSPAETKMKNEYEKAA